MRVCGVRCCAYILAIATSAGLPGLARAGQPILVDGYVNEWGGEPAYLDPIGDGGASGVDFFHLYVTNDDDWLFIRFETTAVIDIEGGSSIVLYLDTDADSGTGVPVGGVGAEMRWRFGALSGTFYDNPPSNTIEWEDIDLRMGPSTWSDEWEVAIGRDVLPDGVAPLFPFDDIAILIRDETVGGDRIPDDGHVVPYTFTNDGPPAPGPIALERDDPGHLRIVSHNVLQDSPWGGGQSARYDRLYSAMDPDVICFQEIYGHTAGEARTLVESWLPSGPGEFWFAAQENDRVTVSRYSVIDRWEVGGNLAILLPTEADIGRDVLLINCHLPCCENDAGRQSQVDEILAFLGDAMTPGGDVDIPEGAGIAITGDMNFVGDPQQLVSFVTGDIVNEGAFGPDIVPDWDGSDLRDRVSIQTERRMAYTWYKESSDFAPSRLDYLIYSDSVLGVGNHYLLYTPNMSPDQLAAYGLLGGDTSIASDHIPLVFDLYDGTATVAVAEGGASATHSLRLGVSPNPARPGQAVSISLASGSLGALEVRIFDVAGRFVRHLVAQGARPVGPILWDGRDTDGRTAASGVYVVRAVGLDLQGVQVEARARLVVLN